MKGRHCLLAVAVVAFCARGALAQGPELINYQGRLLDGTNLYNGVTNIVTMLYTNASGGSPFYTETNQNVTVVDGLYTLAIGDEVTGLEDALTNTTVYLELRIGAVTLAPREQVKSVAYAIHARNSLRSDVSIDAFHRVNGIHATNSTNRLFLQGTNLVSLRNVQPDTIVIDAAVPMTSNVVWVAMNGRVGGSGSIDDPVSVVQFGYDKAAALPGPATLAIAAGQYGPLNFHGTNVHVIGFGRPELGKLDVKNGASAVNGKLRLFNLVFTNVCVFQANATEVKLHHCRMERGVSILGNGIELQNCYATNKNAVVISIGDNATYCNHISINNSAFVLDQMVPFPTMLVTTNVDHLEVLQCEVVRRLPVPGPMPNAHAILDIESGFAGAGDAITNLHLFAFNYIVGPPTDEAAGAKAAVMDHGMGGNPGPPGRPSMAFHHNVVYGDVGYSGPTGQTTQYFSHNMVYGAIAWLQALAAAGMDVHGNFSNAGAAGQPPLPDPWDD